MIIGSQAIDADRHVLDHAAAQRAHLGHRGPPVQGWGESTQILADYRQTT